MITRLWKPGRKFTNPQTGSSQWGVRLLVPPVRPHGRAVHHTSWERLRNLAVENQLQKLAAPAAATQGSSAPRGSRRRRRAGPPKAAAPAAAAAAVPGAAARVPCTRVGPPPSRHESPLSRFSAGVRGPRLKGDVRTPPLLRALKGKRAPGGFRL